jgi:hypothetical protein
MVTKHALFRDVAERLKIPFSHPFDGTITLGEGGTGKSHIIDGYADFLTLRGRRHWLATGSFLGQVASRMSNGATLHSSLKLAVKGNGERDRLKPAKKVQDNFEKAEYFAFDKISTVDSHLFAEASDSLEMNKRPGVAFGGIVPHLFGDFCQLPSTLPKGFPLYEDITESTTKWTKAKTDRRLTIEKGFNLYRKISNVVKLRKNWRTKCLLAEILQRYRDVDPRNPKRNQVTEADLDALEARILERMRELDGSPLNLSLPKWANLTTAVNTNAHRGSPSPWSMP